MTALQCKPWNSNLFRTVTGFTNTIHSLASMTRQNTSQASHIQGVTGGTDQSSGECSLGQTIPI